MALTQEEFLTVVDASSAGMVSIWYNNSVPLTVFGLTVPVLDNTGVNTTQLLQTAQQLNITLSGYNYTFNILTRAERTAPSGTTYYFFTITNQVVDSLADDTSPLLGQILFVIPGFQNTNFFGGDYDALINNVGDSRQSIDIMISDRYKIKGGAGSLNPININELRNLTAEKADVQDSNYTLTGWINGRYQGTSTNSITYGGIDSAITGRSFQGSYYPSGVEIATINQQVSSSATIYTEYLSTSQEDLPTYPTFLGTKYLTVGIITDTLTQIQIKLNPNAANLSDISIGDILKIQSQIADEYIRVDNITTPNNVRTLVVTRNWNKSPTGQYGSSDVLIEKIQGPAKIYQLVGNKIQGIQKGLLVVKDSQELLAIDKLGQVVAV